MINDSESNMHPNMSLSFCEKWEIFDLARELVIELEKLGILQRMKDIPQLGVIRIKKSLRKSRFDYITLQLELHSEICKNKSVIKDLQCSYGNEVKASEFNDGLEYKTDYKKNPSIYDLIQILIITYNIGHFYNTFVASKAALLFAQEDNDFRNLILEASDEENYRCVAKNLLDNMNYQRFHLLNSLLVLQRCDQSKFSVQLAKKLVYAYLGEESLDPKSKLHYVFELFRTVRDVAYIAFDLRIANVPISIDLQDSKGMLRLFEELLAKYNNNLTSKRLISSLKKLLDDTVYNNESDIICYCMLSDLIVRKLENIYDWDNRKYYSIWLDKESVFNCDYPQRKEYEQECVLKLTFTRETRDISRQLFDDLKHTNGVCAGYYDRSGGEQTVVASLRKNCGKSIHTSFRVCGIVIRRLREIPSISNDDSRFLLAVKFFLFYLCGRHTVDIKPTIDQFRCVICTKGKSARINEVNKMIRFFNSKSENSITSPNNNDADKAHEAENLCYVLENDKRNDVCIMLPSSIVVRTTAEEKIEHNEELCEFDGMIIFPNRSDGQVVFLEAKNRKENPIRAKNDLMDKLRKLDIPYDEEAIKIHGKDAFLYYTV